jgi:hypothetical protein
MEEWIADDLKPPPAATERLGFLPGTRHFLDA